MTVDSTKPKPPRGDETVRVPTRPIACTTCAKETAHALQPSAAGCSWNCTTCGGETARYSREDMQAMIEAYAGPLAAAQNLPPRPTFDPAGMEVDVEPKSGGELITYSDTALVRHVACCHVVPAVGATFWGHHPGLAPHVAKFELGKIVAVRRVPSTTL